MSVAEDLFYREGIRATGVDRIVDVSGVSKTSLYRVFQSKDELITAYAEAHAHKAATKWIKAEAAHPGEPRKQLEAALDDVIGSINRPGFRGCPFINLAIEIPDDSHPARLIAVANKAEMQQWFEKIATALGATNSGRVAGELSMLINGAYASGSVTRGSVDGTALKAAVGAVLDASRRDA